MMIEQVDFFEGIVPPAGELAETAAFEAELDREVDEKASDQKEEKEKVYYFLVPTVLNKFAWKSKLKKYLNEEELGEFSIIRGKVIPTTKRVVTKIDID